MAMDEAAGAADAAGDAARGRKQSGGVALELRSAMAVNGTFYNAKLPVGLWWPGRFLIQAGVVLRLPIFTALSA